MARVTSKMGLRVWDQLTDTYDHEQQADNLARIDYHDHTPGRGVLIPSGGIEDGAITLPKLAPEASGSAEGFVAPDSVAITTTNTKIDEIPAITTYGDLLFITYRAQLIGNTAVLTNVYIMIDDALIAAYTGGPGNAVALSPTPTSGLGTIITTAANLAGLVSSDAQTPPNPDIHVAAEGIVPIELPAGTYSVSTWMNAATNGVVTAQNRHLRAWTAGVSV